MSISIEESRYQSYLAIHSIVKRARDLPSRDIWHDDYQTLKELCDGLWHAFIGDTYGLLDSTNQKIGMANSPWATSLQYHFLSGREDEFETRMAEREDQEDDAFDSAPDKEILNDPREMREYENSIAIEYLLENARGGDLSPVYLLYGDLEQLLYLIRSDPGMLSRYEGLSKLISDIQGECFGLFQETDDYAQAYLLNQILTLLFKHDNPVRPFAFQQGWADKLGRSLNLDGVNLKQLQKWHLDALRAKSVTDWIVLAMSIMGRRYHYPEEVEQLFRMANKRKIKLDSKRIREKFAQCVASHTQRDAVTDPLKYFHLCIIHGYDVAREVEDAANGAPTSEEDTIAEEVPAETSHDIT